MLDINVSITDMLPVQEMEVKDLEAAKVSDPKEGHAIHLQD
jgi:hypothetical protein